VVNLNGFLTVGEEAVLIVVSVDRKIIHLINRLLMMIDMQLSRYDFSCDYKRIGWILIFFLLPLASGCLFHDVHVDPGPARIDPLYDNLPIHAQAIVLYNPSNPSHNVTANNTSFGASAQRFTVNIGEAITSCLEKTLRNVFNDVSVQETCDNPDAFIFESKVRQVEWWLGAKGSEGWSGAGETISLNLSLELSQHATPLKKVVAFGTEANYGLSGRIHFDFAGDLRMAADDAIRKAVGASLSKLLADTQVAAVLGIVPPRSQEVALQQPNQYMDWSRLKVRSGESRTTLAVIDFNVGSGIPADTGRTLADLCRQDIVKSKIFKVVDRENIRSILGEQDFAAVVKCNNTKCFVQYGKILHAQRMLHGRISRLGSSIVLSLSITSVNTSEIESTETSMQTSLDDVARRIPINTYRLVADALGR